ncbi:MAG: crossover junction endodeoxyribonuclease RuvC [Candidatus Omnitrophota bacterium]
MRILGIDPGLNTTGYGVVEFAGGRIKLVEAGVIKTSLSAGIKNRLNKIYRALQGLIREQKPQVMVLEKLYTHYRHPTTACLLGHVRGVICLLSAQENLEFFEYSPTRIRKSLIGRGNASKLQTKRMVERIFSLKAESLPLDTSDALAMALAHVDINLRHRR